MPLSQLLCFVLFLASTGVVPTSASTTLSPACNDAVGGCLEAMRAAISACGAPTTGCSVSLDPGTYVLSGPLRGQLLSLTDVSNVEISGYGATVVAASLSHFLSITDCTNVTVSGLTYDMARQPYTYGKVVSVSDQSFTVFVNMSEYPPPMTPDEQQWLTTVQASMSYDPVKHRPADDAYDSYEKTTCSWNTSASTLTVLENSHGQVSVGDWIIVRHQVYSLGFIAGTSAKNVVMKDLFVLSAAGMGFVFDHSEDLTLDNVSVIRAPNRPMSITADATHFNSCKGDVVVRNSVFEGQGDDGCNVHGKFSQVARVNGSSVVVAAPTATKHSQYMASDGDLVAFRDADSLQVKGEAHVASFDPATSTATFTAPIPKTVVPGDVFESLTWRPSFAAVNNTYKNNRARGMLVKTHNAYLAGNRYIGNSGPAVQIAVDDTFWFESGPVQNWTMTGCTIEDVNYGPARRSADVYLTATTPKYQDLSVGQVHEQITVANNHFKQAQGQAAVSVWATNELVVTGNVVVASPAPSAAFTTTSCTNVTVASNVCKLSSSGAPFPCGPGQ